MCCFTASGRGVSIEIRRRVILLPLVAVVRWKPRCATPNATTQELLMKRFLFLTLLCAAIAFAEHYDASVFGALQWRSIGPQRGGRSITSAGSSSRPNEYYFGAVGGGLWKTTDGGTTWQPGDRRADSRAPRWARSRCPNRIPTSFISAWARRNCAATSCRATAFINRSTRARRGSTSGSAIRRRFRAFASIRRIADIVYVSALGHPYGAECGARRVPLARRRQDVAEGSV